MPESVKRIMEVPHSIQRSPQPKGEGVTLQEQQPKSFMGPLCKKTVSCNFFNFQCQFPNNQKSLQEIGEALPARHNESL